MKITTNRTLSVIIFFITAFMLFEIVDTSNIIEQPQPTPVFQASAEAVELIATTFRIIENNNSPVDICGTDDRVRSTNAAVGRIRMADGGICTGFIISNGLLITAGHCITFVPNVSFVMPEGTSRFPCFSEICSAY
ncbi:MAG: hypothetical protein WD022_03650 [Balneolaceae bacterium]